MTQRPQFQAATAARRRLPRPKEKHVLVRAGNEGEWIPLTPVDVAPTGGFRALCGVDAANVLELDTPMPVAAFGPWPVGMPAGVDAVCLTASGDVELLLGTWGEDPRDTLWRLLDVAGALRGTRLEDFGQHLTELGGETSVTRWLHDRVGGDAHALEARLRHVLETGEFGFVLVTPDGAGDLAQPLQFVEGMARIRVFEVEVLRAGGVEAIEGTEVRLAGITTERAPVARAAAPAGQVSPLAVVAEPAPRPEPGPAFVDPVVEHGAAVESAPAPAPTPEPPSAPEASGELPPAPEDPSDVDAFLRYVDRLDHRTSTHLRWLHDALLRLVDEAEYTTDGDRQFLTGWMHGSQRLPLFLVDSRGLLQLVIASLPEHEQAEYAEEVAAMLPDVTGAALLAAGYADVDVPGHLDDQTLLEYLVDNLVEALPGGREAFGTTAREESEPAPAPERSDDPSDDGDGGAGFFDGVSATHDPSGIEDALVGLGDPTTASTTSRPAPEPGPEPQPDREWAEATEAPRHGGSRWLRRRGAA